MGINNKEPLQFLLSYETSGFMCHIVGFTFKSVLFSIFSFLIVLILVRFSVEVRIRELF
jgi:hypothetical protein